MLYYFDLMGVAVFAASGVLAARDRNLDIFGLIMVATLTAIGGGTIRDLLLDRHPIFWVVDSWYLVVIIASAVTTILYLKWRPPPGTLFLVADTLGLALFALSGATLALAAGHSPLIVIIMGVMTGTMGGMLRDVITARVPLILQKEIYATAALCGVVVYLLAMAAGINDLMAFGAGFATVVALRLIAIRWGINLPVIRV
ncbi:trimeric intracellular cation channel family protein [Ectothiorhodospira variabilis]|uniref:trimeric intracellular cation channel family protein n=1 Tax=Ectothiorhodospira variabilis TaxID=505694 RepID=UPI001EFB7FB5|nr:trimeric intracellular cation channel family protein [Ectothiorhodospira variabilis]MCG5495025.1 trimeric intracellular cation channel family protein [Ectothiorhodospira variabilis]MCG5498204.1 trimeric intracellular cation channel family protein [Ectothiorhodospira variabilis]MCG5504612.1 trimeric intracellular cation channel family protein [Ectothiorhodospira variabilis]MCG5507835.1 trimeric intracellular cation channel family protein [Ectothiorhodospira variabilis]